MLKEITHCISPLQGSNLILYPTDTIWGVGCDATSDLAVKRLFNLKKRPLNKAMICLVSDIEMLKRYIKDVPLVAISAIHSWEKPLTIIYKNPKGIAQDLITPDGTLAIRVVREPFCKTLISTFGKPIVSTSANISGGESPTSFKEIALEILKNVAYTVNLHRDKKCNAPSSIVKISDTGDFTIIRS